MIGNRAEEVLNRAVRYAFDRQHEFFTLEHVLLSLLEESDILEAIQACNGSFTELKADLENYLDQQIPKAKKMKPEGEESNGDILESPVATLSIQRLVQRALFHVQSAGKDEIHPEDLFVAIFQAKDSYALHLLQKQGVERLDVLNYFSHGTHKDDASHTSRNTETHIPQRQQKTSKISSENALDLYTINLNQEAKKGKIDPLVGRNDELERVIQTLCRRRKNNPLLVGEAGVGKTALAEGLAVRIVDEAVPPILKDAVVYSLDLGSLLAGAKFRGDFEQRLKKVVKALEDIKSNRGYPILFIDEIHTIIGAGAVSGGALDAANILKPVLSRGEIQCIGSTTYNEYRNIFEKDHALARRFQKIDIVEPSAEETVQILNGLKTHFETHHGVKYLPDAIRAAVDLSVKHIRDRFLPDKAIDVIDEVGARMKISRMQPPELGNESPIEISVQHIEEMIAKIARIPARSVSTSQKKRLKSLQRDLKITIFGQDHAIDALVTAIQLARSGLRTGERPVGAFLFCGPTGVGKTELSKQLSKSMGVPFLRFDMSEYSEKHTLSRLIGAPPGYVGFEQAGLLTDAIIKNPHSIVLLDEIEKSHTDIWNILLQIMDHGTLTDNNGRKADFRNAILIMTSNIGTREQDRRPLGVGPAQLRETVSKSEVERAFSPEFRNRLDAIVYFNTLDPLTVAQVVGKQILELESQLLAKDVEVEIDPEVREWLAEKGYDRSMGARPLARLIQDQVKKPLSEEVLFGRLEKGGHVRISLIHDEKPVPAPTLRYTEKLRFEFSERKVSPSRVQEYVGSGESGDRA